MNVDEIINRLDEFLAGDVSQAEFSEFLDLLESDERLKKEVHLRDDVKNLIAIHQANLHADDAAKRVLEKFKIERSMKPPIDKSSIKGNVQEAIDSVILNFRQLSLDHPLEEKEDSEIKTESQDTGRGVVVDKESLTEFNIKVDEGVNVKVKLIQETMELRPGDNPISVNSIPEEEGDYKIELLFD